MAPDKDRVYLQHIIDEINRIGLFLNNVSKEELLSDDITESHYAIVRSLEIIGEAASKLSADFKSAHTDIPWQIITGMRNKIIHEYMSIDYQVVWETIHNDLPLLKSAVEAILTKG
uniref:DUF86 domain-containing protein n=1 Tax=candidate division WWE3 bacterium TaxID=2053526 RepID=A0A7C4XHK7_UNCKA